MALAGAAGGLGVLPGPGPSREGAGLAAKPELPEGPPFCNIQVGAEIKSSGRKKQTKKTRFSRTWQVRNSGLWERLNKNRASQFPILGRINLKRFFYIYT